MEDHFINGVLWTIGFVVIVAICGTVISEPLVGIVLMVIILIVGMFTGLSWMISNLKFRRRG